VPKIVVRDRDALDLGVVEEPAPRELPSEVVEVHGVLHLGTVLERTDLVGGNVA
jgi:hypothetical protein